MEPHREEEKGPEPRAEPKPKRFRIVKLEERIAPRHGKATQAGPTCPVATGYYCGPSACCMYGTF
jgi:hypothetical protein